MDWAVQLDAWGNVRVEHNPSGLYQPIRQPGQHADGDTGLYYNRYRYYESGMGGYINQDPMGLEAGINLDKYVKNPLQWIDVLGLQGWASVPMLNGSLPGNQGALSKAMELTCSDCSSSAEPYISDETLRKFGIPSNKDEWADYLSTQSDSFGLVSAVLMRSRFFAPAGIALGAVSIAADAGSKTLKPQPVTALISDTALDLFGEYMPGGVIKDAAIFSVKKLLSSKFNSTTSKTENESDKTCKKSNY